MRQENLGRFEKQERVFPNFPNLQPELTDWDKEHVEMKWTPPTEDGGAPIEEYIVEMREKFSPQWKPVATVPASAAPQASVGGLQEGEEYEFRVVAKNKAGKGEPSDPSDAVVAKDRNGQILGFSILKWHFFFQFHPKLTEVPFTKSASALANHFNLTFQLLASHRPKSAGTLRGNHWCPMTA